MTATLTQDDSSGCLVNADEYLHLWNRVCELEIPCAELVTRAELLALANAGDLDMSCHYAMAKNGNGCLGNVVIMIEPTSTSSLSANVAVLTTHSPQAWAGHYSINENTIDSLQDHRGNNVSGDNQTEVDRFPWANTGWYNVTVDHATVLTECDTAFRVNDTEFKNGSITELRGATGRIQGSTISDGAILELDAATNAQINRATFMSRGRVYAEGTTNLQITGSTVDSEGYWFLRGQADARLIYSRLGSATRVNYQGGTRQWFYYCEINSYAQVRQLSGVIQMYYSSMDSYGEFRNEAGAGTALIYGINFSTRAYVRNYNTNRIRLYHVDVSSRGEIRFRDSADFIMYYSNVSEYGLLTIQGATTVAYTQRVDSQARVTFNGGNHYRNRFSSYSRVTTAFNTRDIHTDGSFAQTLTAANSNTYRGFGTSTLV